jgi:hypothetical protein
MSGYYKMTLDDIANNTEKSFGNRKDLLNTMSLYGSILFLVSFIQEMDITRLTDADYWLDYLKQEADDNGESLG